MRHHHVEPEFFPKHKGCKHFGESINSSDHGSTSSNVITLGCTIMKNIFIMVEKYNYFDSTYSEGNETLDFDTP